ncbi:MAG: hypothetical protein AAGF32_00085 [Pseudomonadota bacterium]
MSRRLTFNDAVVIWIGRWLGVSTQRLARRYDVDRRRLYEVWTFARHPRAWDEARRLYGRLYPERVGRTDFGEHRRTGKWAIPGQLDMFG